MFNKVVIIGTGMIGGSLGLALKKQKLAGKIIGLSRHRQNAVLAKKAGAIDQIGVSLDVVADADLVILATPIDTIIGFALKVSKKIKNGCIVIDVGSTKEQIVAKASALIPDFVGCHPLAGSEKKGILNLQSSIFQGSTCIITPVLKTNKLSLRKVKGLWKRIGARVVILSPEKHDRILAFTSHLPHAVAFSLMSAVPDRHLEFSSTGLKDTTRISGSDPWLWSEIFLSNRGNLLAALTDFQKKLTALKLALGIKNKKKLIQILQAAKKRREKLK